MIQDIFPHHYHNEYRPEPPKPRDYVFGYEDGRVILKSEDWFFRYEDLPEGTEVTYLFAMDDHNCYYWEGLASLSHVTISRMDLRPFQPRFTAFAAIAGWQIVQWMNNNRYCGRCGRENKQDSKERAMRCPECDRVVYPTIMPAVIVGVLNKETDQLLVTKYSQSHSAYNRYALVAGFNEVGETIEETVSREVKEETGLDVENIRYYKSQPWPFTSTLLLGFYCDVKGSAEIHIDEDELKLAKWADRDEEIDSMDNASLTTEMIQNFLKGKEL